MYYSFGDNKSTCIKKKISGINSDKSECDLNINEKKINQKYMMHWWFPMLIRIKINSIYHNTKAITIRTKRLVIAILFLNFENEKLVCLKRQNRL